MSQKTNHKRILLNRNESGQIEYCESCEVVEMEIGPVSIRLHAKDLTVFNELIQAAEQRLRYYNMEKMQFDAEMLKVGGVH